MCLMSIGYLSLLTVLRSGVAMTLLRDTCRYIDVTYLCLYAIYSAKVSLMFPSLDAITDSSQPSSYPSSSFDFKRTHQTAEHLCAPL